MIAEITHRGRTFRVDLSKPIDLSLPLHDGEGQLRAWWVGPVTMEPVRDGDKVYAVKQGAPVNFRNINFNPHGHGTHAKVTGKGFELALIYIAFTFQSSYSGSFTAESRSC